MKKRILMTMALAMMLLFAHITVEQAFSQPQQSITMSGHSEFAAASRSDKPNDIALKLKMLEYKLDIETKYIEKRYEDFSKSATFFMSILSAFVALLTIFSIYKSIQQHKDYITERNFFTEQVTKRENSEGLFEVEQLENIQKLNSVIGLVEKSFHLLKEREEKQTNLVDELKGMKIIIEEFEREAKEKYRDVKELILSLENVKAMEWPKLPYEFQCIAAKARNKFENVSRVVLNKEEEQNPIKLAKVLQLLGISAFYSNDIASAIKQLSEADRIYEDKLPPSEDPKSRAYTKHFLGVIAKNWRKKDDITLGNVNEAYGYLSKASEIFKNEPKQFLIPVTLAEILSYLPDMRAVAAVKIDEIIERFIALGKKAPLDPNQHSLFVRTLLLKGNLCMTENKHDEAEKCYSDAIHKDSQNPYGHLSLLHAQGSSDIEKWKNALSQLERSGATKKPETVTKVIAIVWAVIAAHKGEDNSSQNRYLNDLQSLGTSSSLIDREPLFFSPLAKDLEDFKTLKENLGRYLEN
ncbi:MAG: hypothetical protein ABSB95_14575 [Dissulfurispiraceae bacterium]